jgi:hypothetical protein
MKYYNNFNNKNADGQSIIHLINLLLTEKIIGIEIGVSTGLTFCTFLQQCPNIVELHGIDPYMPYIDYLKYEYDGNPLYVIDEKEIDFAKITAMHNIKYSGHAEKVIFHHEKSQEVVKTITDCYFDFIFLDSYMKPGEIYEEMTSWYPKLKHNGLFAGHDWDCDSVRKEVEYFFNSNNINRYSVFDNTWCFIKK